MGYFQLPPTLPPSALASRLVGNVVVYPSPTAAAQTTIFRPGARWRFEASWTNRKGLPGDAAGSLDRVASFFEYHAERGSHFWFHPGRLRGQQGPALADDLISGSFPVDATTPPQSLGWSLEAGDAGVSGFRFFMKLGTVLQQTVTVTSDDRYILVGDWRRFLENSTGSINVRIGTTAGATDVLNVNLDEEQEGRFAFPVTAPTGFSSLFVQIRNTDPANRVAFDRLSLLTGGPLAASRSRGDRVFSMNAEKGAIERGVLLGGYVEIEGELKRLTSDATFFDTGTAVGNISPGLHAAKAPGDVVLLGEPCCLVQCLEPVVNYRRGGFGDIEATMTEVFPNGGAYY